MPLWICPFSGPKHGIVNNRQGAKFSRTRLRLTRMDRQDRTTDSTQNLFRHISDQEAFQSRSAMSTHCDHVSFFFRCSVDDGIRGRSQSNQFSNARPRTDFRKAAIEIFVKIGRALGDEVPDRLVNALLRNPLLSTVVKGKILLFVINHMKNDQFGAEGLGEIERGSNRNR